MWRDSAATPLVTAAGRPPKFTHTPPSSGGVALVQLLNLLERYEPARLGRHSAAHVHLVAELEKRVFADRAEYLGDPDFVKVVDFGIARFLTEGTDAGLTKSGQIVGTPRRGRRGSRPPCAPRLPRSTAAR